MRFMQVFMTFVMAQTYYVVSGRYHWCLPKKMQILLGYCKSLSNVPFISLKFLIVLSLDPQILDLILSLFPTINYLRGSWLKWSSTILPAKGDSFLLGRCSSFVVLLPVSSPQAPGRHPSCAGEGCSRPCGATNRRISWIQPLPHEPDLGYCPALWSMMVLSGCLGHCTGLHR